MLSLSSFSSSMIDTSGMLVNKRGSPPNVSLQTIEDTSLSIMMIRLGHALNIRVHDLTWLEHATQSVRYTRTLTQKYYEGGKRVCRLQIGR